MPSLCSLSSSTAAELAPLHAKTNPGPIGMYHGCFFGYFQNTDGRMEQRLSSAKIHLLTALSCLVGEERRMALSFNRLRHLTSMFPTPQKLGPTLILYGTPSVGPFRSEQSAH